MGLGGGLEFAAGEAWRMEMLFSLGLKNGCGVGDGADGGFDNTAAGIAGPGDTDEAGDGEDWAEGVGDFAAVRTTPQITRPRTNDQKE
jgi:hypothetical protein